MVLLSNPTYPASELLLLPTEKNTLLRNTGTDSKRKIVKRRGKLCNDVKDILFPYN